MSFEEFKSFCLSYNDIRLKHFLSSGCELNFLEDLISEVKNITYYNILYLRCVEHRTILYISKCLGYSYRHTQRLYVSSLHNLYEVYQQKHTTK